MPYYLYKIIPGPTDLLKTLEKIEEHDSFKEAKQRARSLRAEMTASENYSIKVMFADSELQAEEQLMEKREQPILREWEK
jgi:methionine synthase II (cobalamin-independent)